MIREEVDDSLSQMLPTNARIHNNILNVPNFAAISQKFLLHKHASGRNDLSGSQITYKRKTETNCNQRQIPILFN